MRLDGLLNLDKLADDIDNGYVTVRVHPTNQALLILNYADKCQYEPYWTDVTRKTRGLIYDRYTMEIVSRPFEKFFNYGQEAGVEFDLDAPLIGAFDKLDGSLGIAYWDGEKFAIATRGSFESDQAKHATKLLHHPDNEDILSAVVKSYHDDGMTALFEIIYPENRIVIDYGALDSLEFLGHVDNETGEFFPNHELLVNGSLRNPTLRQVLDFPDRENREGLIVWIDRRTAVKIKQADYIELHRIVSHLSQKEVWRQLLAGTYKEFVEKLPDEFYGWADATAEELQKMFWDVEATATSYFDDVKQFVEDDRKAQAIWISANVPSEFRGMVFSLLDGRDISESVWKRVEPIGSNPMKVIVE